MVPYVTDVELNWTTFADHAVIMVTLADIDKPPLVPMWRKPKPILWPKPGQPSPPWDCQVTPNDDIWYQALWHDVENYASYLQESLGQPPLQAHQRGRAATDEVVWTQGQVAPVKPNRRGDIQSELACTNMMHSRWTKQVRRLQHFSRLARSNASTVTTMEHRASLWRKIRTAMGFTQGFAAWWSQQVHMFPKSPQQLPMDPPDADVAENIFLEFSRSYRELEHSLRKARHDFAKHRRLQDPNVDL